MGWFPLMPFHVFPMQGVKAVPIRGQGLSLDGLTNRSYAWFRLYLQKQLKQRYLVYRGESHADKEWGSSPTSLKHDDNIIHKYNGAGIPTALGNLAYLLIHFCKCQGSLFEDFILKQILQEHIFLYYTLLPPPHSLKQSFPTCSKELC